MLPTKFKISIALATIFTVLIAGTIIYHFVEGWSVIDSFYVTGVTLTTVGYGDITPHTDFGKIFSVFLAFIGITVVFYSVSIIASLYFERQQHSLEKRFALLEKIKARENQKRSILDRLREKRQGP
jgi:voltage-gated potassium channel